MQSLLFPFREKNHPMESEQMCWVGMTPLEWMDSLKAGTASPQVNSSNLKKTDKHCSPMKQGNPSKRKARSTPFGSPVPSMTSPMGALQPEIAAQLRKVPSYRMPMYWDFRSFRPNPTLECIRLLVLAIEGHAKFMEVKLPFERTRDQFCVSVAQIDGYNPLCGGKMDALCHEIIQKLQAVLLLANKLAHEWSSPALHIPRDTFSSPTNHPHPGTNFDDYMTRWLQENWLNPYPDEVSLQQMSQESGASMAAIGAWLVDARSDKWRPALEAAVKMKRPSTLLWEDSINILNGTPLRLVDSPNAEDMNKRQKTEERN